MKDLLTPEQREMVERIREKFLAPDHENFKSLTEMSMAAGIIFGVLDKISTPKKYTEEELRAKFSKVQEEIYVGMARSLEKAFKSPEAAAALDDDLLIGWLACARFLGVIEEEKP